MKKEKRRIIRFVKLLLITFLLTNTLVSNAKSLKNIKHINRKKIQDSGIRFKRLKMEGKYENITLPGDYKFAKDGFKVLESDGNKLYGTIDNKKLYKTEGLNDIRIFINEFENDIVSMYILENGNILLGTSNSRWHNPTEGELYLSKDGGYNFKKVIDLEAGDAFHWNFASDGNGNVYVSEYGIKSVEGNARKIYKSSDYGENFEVTYNPKKEQEYHNHKILVDSKDNNIIYQVIGDDNKRLLISKDKGKTWDSIRWGNYHPTSMIDMGEYLLLGLDGAPYAGIARYNKKTKKVEEVYRTPKPYGGSIYTMIEHEGIIYAANMSYINSQPWDGSIMISKDKGKTWKIEYTFDKLDFTMGVGLTKFISHNDEIYVLCQIPYLNQKTNELDHYRGTIQIK